MLTAPLQGSIVLRVDITYVVGSTKARQNRGPRNRYATLHGKEPQPGGVRGDSGSPIRGVRGWRAHAHRSATGSPNSHTRRGGPRPCVLGTGLIHRRILRPADSFSLELVFGARDIQWTEHHHAPAVSIGHIDAPAFVDSYACRVGERSIVKPILPE